MNVLIKCIKVYKIKLNKNYFMILLMLGNIYFCMIILIDIKCFVLNIYNYKKVFYSKKNCFLCFELFFN